MGHENTHLAFPEAVSENNLFSWSTYILNPCTKLLIYNCWFDWMYNLNLKAFQVLFGNHRQFPCSKRERSVYFSLIRWDGGFNRIKWGEFWLKEKSRWYDRIPRAEQIMRSVRDLHSKLMSLVLRLPIVRICLLYSDLQERNSKAHHSILLLAVTNIISFYPDDS